MIWAARGALLAALLLLPLQGQLVPLGPLSLAPSELLILLAALGVCAERLLDRRGRWPTPTSFDPAIGLFLLSALLSLLVTEYWRLSLRELRTLILVPVLSYYLVLACFPGRDVVRPLGAFLVGAVGVSVAGLVGAPFGWGISLSDGVPRLQATYQSANHLGLLLGRALPWLIALVWLGGGWRRPGLGGSLAIGVALLLSFSRGAWLGSAAAGAVVAGTLGGPRRLVAIGLPGLVLAVLAFLAFRGQETAYFRLHLWQSSLAMIRDHPLLGIGLDNFLYLYQQRYIRPEALAEANLSHPHNLVLHFWLQLGLLGLVAAGALVGQAVVLGRRLLAPSNDRLTRALAAGALGSLADFVIHGSIDNSYFLLDLAVVFWLTLAVLESTRRQVSEGAGCRVQGAGDG